MNRKQIEKRLFEHLKNKGGRLHHTTNLPVHIALELGLIGKSSGNRSQHDAICRAIIAILESLEKSGKITIEKDRSNGMHSMTIRLVPQQP